MKKCLLPLLMIFVGANAEARDYFYTIEEASKYCPDPQSIIFQNQKFHATFNNYRFLSSRIQDSNRPKYLKEDNTVSDMRFTLYDGKYGWGGASAIWCFYTFKFVYGETERPMMVNLVGNRIK